MTERSLGLPVSLFVFLSLFLGLSLFSSSLSPSLCLCAILSFSLSLSCFQTSHKLRAWKLRSRSSWQWLECWHIGLAVKSEAFFPVMFQVTTNSLWSASAWPRQMFGKKHTEAAMANLTFLREEHMVLLVWPSQTPDKRKHPEAEVSWYSLRFHFGVWVASPTDCGLLLLSAYLCWQPEYCWACW